MRSVITCAAALLWLGLCGGACETDPRRPPPLDPAREAELAAWLDAHAQDPQFYVLGLFDEHDVVFLGEQHRVKHDLLLVQSLLPALQESGVHVLATEFARREDQPLIDSLLQAPDWDEALARRILFQQFVFWGYQEYVDVFRAAWELNRRRAPHHPPFRILGINDSPDWSVVRDAGDRDKGAIMRQVWRGGGEDHWAETILAAVRAGEKVLVHCGIHHAFTEYRQPVVAEGRFVRFDESPRCGNHVFAALSKRTVTVFLHAPWRGAGGYGSPLQHPAGGVIDALMLARGPRPCGFDVATGPFGEIRDSLAVYHHGYDDFRLSDFCDGWIYTRPISEYEGVTPIEGWIDADNLSRARAQSPNPAFRDASIQRFHESIARAADLSRRWGHLR
ncbi:MAG: hypothetical protein GF330_02345 [Candidatus Eisenbacteria bacterium]|nr:hypothetical protein [Candidatus Eisenbacteria bacterium]